MKIKFVNNKSKIFEIDNQNAVNFKFKKDSFIVYDYNDKKIDEFKIPSDWTLISIER